VAVASGKGGRRQIHLVAANLAMASSTGPRLGLMDGRHLRAQLPKMMDWYTSIPAPRCFPPEIWSEADVMGFIVTARQAVIWPDLDSQGQHQFLTTRLGPFSTYLVIGLPPGTAGDDSAHLSNGTAPLRVIVTTRRTQSDRCAQGLEMFKHVPAVPIRASWRQSA